ncbi:thiamine pyrophosphate-binding protein, partial [Saccharomonospora saliphila]|uniref:thiamine pyrophosphate-binding protein n=1 Tax=Saccharomonospora saliphila TaxID=369829 RepID=UPI00037EEDC1
MASTGARTLVETLTELGVEVAFGLPGVHTLPLWDALASSDIAVLGVRHEQAAGYAADGFARATGALGVALVTTGPGAANVLAAVGEARASGSPVLVLASEVPSNLRRAGTVRASLHEIGDQRALFAPVAKAAFSVERPGELGAVLRHAARLALTPQSGPVYVGVPADFLDAEVDPGPEPTGAHAAGAVDADGAPLPPVPVEDLDEARTALATARR